MYLRRWLRPGIGVKRWLLVVFAGLLLLAVAAAHAIRQVAQDLRPGDPISVIVDAVTFQFLPYPVRGLLVGLAGTGLVVYGALRTIRAVVEPIRTGDPDQPLVEVIYQKRFLARSPRIVAIGGGTGLATLLRGLKERTSNLTAVVTVADDGGSSGRLREALGIPPVGDIRNCIVALADAEPLMGELLQFRFPETEGPGSEVLGGHAVGNMLIAAMCAIEDGDFEEGVRQMNRVLAVRGQVLPVSPTPITLHARLRSGEEIVGESRIGPATGIERVWITPDDVAPAEDALTAIAEADVIVLGPGSLYTSILPSLLIPGIRDAVAASPAIRIYVCNVATQLGETARYDLSDHVEALEAHTTAGLVDIVLANNRFEARAPGEWHGEHVRLRWPPSGGHPPRLVLDDVVDPENAHHHEPARLATSIMRLVERESGARRRSASSRPGARTA